MIKIIDKNMDDNGKEELRLQPHTGSGLAILKLCHLDGTSYDEYYDGEWTSFLINREQAILIINELKEQFKID